jgi:hypothetical protein
MNKNTFIKNLNILDGIITYNDFDIDPKNPFENQKYSFKEDILQIKFGSRFILDVGWQPEFDEKGYFITRVVIDHDWMNPLLELKCKDLGELKKDIEKASIVIKLKKEQNLPYRDVEFDTYE